MKDSSRFLVAFFIIFWGISILLNQFGVRFWGIDFGNFWGTFWPLILIFIGFTLIKSENSVPGFILIALGGLFQISELTAFDIWSMFLPMVLIGAGLLVLSGKKIQPKPKSGHSSNQDELNETVIFWGLEKRIESENFKGGNITCVFGGAEIDLRDVKVSEKGAELVISCAFGGVEILVSEQTNVEIGGTPFLAGMETNFKTTKSGPVLKIVINVAFGGIEVRN